MVIGDHLVIVGGGPVGLLTALFIAIRLDADHKPLYPHITVLEKRGDLRCLEDRKSYSKQEYNVVLSYRGLHALSKIPGLLDLVFKEGVCYSRMQNCIRTDEFVKGFATFTPGEKLSIGRNKVVEILLNFIETEFKPQISVSFGESVVDVDFKNKKVYTLPSDKSQHPFGDFSNFSKVKVINFSTLIGADGSSSIVGEKLYRSVIGVNYSRICHPEPFLTTLLAHKELKCAKIDFHPATMYTVNGRVEGVSLIALPNRDSMGVNLIFESRDKNSADTLLGLTTSFELRKFLNESFPTLGEVLFKSFTQKFAFDDATTPQPFNLPNDTFQTVQYSQFHHPTCPALILGDAAHTMPPTIGQGINCGFKDAYELSKLLDLTRDDWAKAPAIFTLNRQPEAEAIQSLSKLYLHERGRFTFKLRLGFDIGRSILAKKLPKGWIQPTVNQLLSQTDVPYTKVLRARQRHFITGGAVTLSALTSFGYLAFKSASRLLT